MICLKCGTKANKGDTICPNCKTPLQAVSYEFDMSVSDMFNMNNQNKTDTDIKDNINNDKTDTSQIADTQNSGKKTIKKSTILAVIIGVVLVFSVLLIVVNVYEEKKRKEYIISRTVIFNESDLSFGFFGYDGYGVTDGILDRTKVYNALMPALGFEKEDINTRPILKDIYEHINITFSKKNNLSNGQEITVSISVDESCLEEYDIYFDDMEYQVTVKGLDEIKDVDIFENLYVDIVENNGVNSVTWDYLGMDDLIIKNYITIHPDCNLNYGDKFVLSINADRAGELRKELGINPVVLEKEYVMLENEYEYLSDYESISDNVIECLSQKDIKKMKENSDINGVNFKNCKAMGGLLYRFEETENSVIENCLVLLYKVNAPYPDTSISSMYVWIAHFDLVQNTYGLQNCMNNYTVTGYPTVYYNDEKGAYEGVYIEDTLKDVIKNYNMQEDRISYDSALKLYLEE